jgi:hypothetical protein
MTAPTSTSSWLTCVPDASDAGASRPKRWLNGKSLILDYVRDHPERAELVADALEAICQDTHLSTFPHVDLVTIRGAQVLMLDGDDLVLVWRPYADFQAYFQAIFLGPFDGIV